MDTGISMNEHPERAGLSGRAGILLGMGLGIFLSLLCLAMIAVWVWIDNTDTTADCQKRGASISDVLRVQTFASGMFRRPVWTQSFSSSPQKVTKTWLSSDLSAVSYLEYLVYDCGYTPADIDNYYSDENFKNILLQNYQETNKTAECEKDGLLHFEFTADYNKTSYLIYYWAKQESSSRLLSLMMAFPTTEEAKLKAYAQQIYPTLANCQ